MAWKKKQQLIIPAAPCTTLGAFYCTGGHSPQQICWLRSKDLTGKLPSVPVGQGETGPSYPGRYKAHRCKCRERLQLPPLSGSTRLPAGSSQNTATVRNRELIYPARLIVFPSAKPRAAVTSPGDTQFHSQHPRHLLSCRETWARSAHPSTALQEGLPCSARTQRHVGLSHCCCPTHSQASSNSPKHLTSPSITS